MIADEPVFPKLKLLSIYEMVAHGSTYPSRNITGLEKIDVRLFGTLSEFGARQMYLRGVE